MSSVQVLMSTYNGEKYLREQIDSILTQKDVDVHLTVRDDGSSDKTLDILQKYADAGKITLLNGENIGYKKSFLLLLDNAEQADYYAFADQDDVWDQDKLISAVDMMKLKNNEIPILYNGNARLVDRNLFFICDENKNPKISLGSTFVKNFATGCTVVFNNALRNVIKQCNPKYISGHDSWLCRSCIAVGGVVLFDNIPHISYRQHSANTIGSSSISKMAKIKFRINRILNDKSHSRRRTAKELLLCYSELISAEDAELLNLISSYNEIPWGKFKLIANKQLTCGKLSDDILFRIAVLIGYI